MSLLFAVSLSTNFVAHENRKSAKYRKKKTSLTNEQKKKRSLNTERRIKPKQTSLLRLFFRSKFKIEIYSRSVGNYLKDFLKNPEQSINAPKMTKGQVLKFKLSTNIWTPI